MSFGYQVLGFGAGGAGENFVTASGGTESNNTILCGIPTDGLNHIITSTVEHEAVLEPCRHLEKNGVKVTYLSVDEHGMVNPNDITNSINPQTVIVSVMLANNEVGTIQPIKEISKICLYRSNLFDVHPSYLFVL